MSKDFICPLCGEDMEHWNMDIYECGNCNYMIVEEDLEDIYMVN